MNSFTEDIPPLVLCLPTGGHFLFLLGAGHGLKGTFVGAKEIPTQPAEYKGHLYPTFSLPEKEVFVWERVEVNSSGEISRYFFPRLRAMLLFEKLIQLEGVGPKKASEIFDKSGQALIASAMSLLARDIAMLKGIPPKAAQELQKMALDEGDAVVPKKVVANADAVASLVTLGKKKADAEKAVLAAMEQKPNAPLEELIRLALRQNTVVSR